ncbi:DUF2442 domain-containing protein [Candidatus Sumerlaeota bacterium]|nr:DUF2442 domain-containing protein [Candidatus Sumerlaeota bacterium]
MHYVVDASYVDGYRLKICFGNDEVRVVDLLAHLDGPVFEPLRDLSFFRQFKVNHDIDTVVWPNDADFSPDFLYEIGEPVSEPLHPADAVGHRC